MGFKGGVVVDFIVVTNATKAIIVAIVTN